MKPTIHPVYAVGPADARFSYVPIPLYWVLELPGERSQDYRDRDEAIAACLTVCGVMPEEGEARPF